MHFLLSARRFRFNICIPVRLGRAVPFFLRPTLSSENVGDHRQPFSNLVFPFHRLSCWSPGIKSLIMTTTGSRCSSCSSDTHPAKSRSVAAEIAFLKQRGAIKSQSRAELRPSSASSRIRCATAESAARQAVAAIQPFPNVLCSVCPPGARPSTATFRSSTFSRSVQRRQQHYERAELVRSVRSSLSNPADMLALRGFSVSSASRQASHRGVLYPGAERLLFRHVTPTLLSLQPG